MVYIDESRHGVSLESMFTWEVPYKLPFQECGTTFLAALGVHMAWVLPHPPPSLLHSICSRDLNSASCNPCWYTKNLFLKVWSSPCVLGT